MNVLKILFSSVIFLFLSGLAYSQDSNIVISETGEADICGKIVYVDALWVYEGMLKADISILENRNSKPITGGYKKGDEITISSEPGCTYYIYSITKYGISKSKGTVTISKSPPAKDPVINNGSFTAYENYSFKVGLYDWYISSIFDDGKNISANITITKNSELIENLVLKKGDHVWMGENLFKVRSLRTKFKDHIKDPSGYYEYNPGEISFIAVTEYIPER